MDVARSEITTVNAAIGWKNRDWEVSVSILNPLDGTNADIAYFILPSWRVSHWAESLTSISIPRNQERFA